MIVMGAEESRTYTFQTIYKRGQRRDSPYPITDSEIMIRLLKSMI
jgi:hypothetical protein